MTTKTYNVYKFDELSDKAKQRVIDQHADFLSQEDWWWQDTYDEAEGLGFKITEFDINRGNYIKLELTTSWPEVAEKIVGDHGESCETFKIAKAFLIARYKIVDEEPKDEGGEFVSEFELDACDKEFARDIGEDYLQLLRKEYEYQTSDEQVIESIKANDYDFTEDGQLD